LTSRLGSLIGYDEKIGDINDIEREVDDVISKLLVLLEKCGEM
jgi:hypothetical protein